MCAASRSTLETSTSFKLAVREPLTSLSKVYEHALPRRATQYSTTGIHT